MFQSIADLVANHFTVSLNQVVWLAQMPLVLSCLILLPIACLSEIFTMRTLLMSFNLLLIIGSIIKIAAGRLHFEWLIFGHMLQMSVRVAYNCYAGNIANIWCRQDEISRGTAANVAGYSLGIGLAYIIPPLVLTNQFTDKVMNETHVSYFLSIFLQGSE